jgi:hypothetical protein
MKSHQLLTNFPVFGRFCGSKRQFFDDAFQTTEALSPTEFTEKIFDSKLSFLSGFQCFSVKKRALDRWQRNSDCAPPKFVPSLSAHRRCELLLTTLTLIAVSPFALAQAPAEYETPVLLQASTLLPADQRQGPSHRVRDLVATDGYMAHFQIDSDFGTFEAIGVPQVKVRIAEINAIRTLVDSIRVVSPGLAIEDGVHHLTPADGENAPARSTTYTAVLAKTDNGEWRIASTRSLHDETVKCRRWLADHRSGLSMI